MAEKMIAHNDHAGCDALPVFGSVKPVFDFVTLFRKLFIILNLVYSSFPG